MGLCCAGPAKERHGLDDGASGLHDMSVNAGKTAQKARYTLESQGPIAQSHSVRLDRLQRATQEHKCY